ncbi:MAG: hypothetical protein M1835_001885 [Candelina submexicana]|nr:MAG: hypothetical protein M1835_001885 [Candelina submexicana]
MLSIPSISHSGLDSTLEIIGAAIAKDAMIKRSVLQINEEWAFRQASDESSTFLPVAQFPTNVHLNLIANGVITDPFFSQMKTRFKGLKRKPGNIKQASLAPQEGMKGLY